MSPLIIHEQVIGILGDGDFYNYDLVECFLHKQVFFIIRGRVNTGVKPLIQKYQDKLLHKGNTTIVDYRLNKGRTRRRVLVKLVLSQEDDRTVVLVVPPICQLSGKEIISLYRNRFMIEIYYRQMHRF